ncbi:type II toxin-antitoxin system prevent-host-death family antitoxin [Sphingomonas flavalba]|uniref:type II toxin-antitoxin system prevent-host-death family antitoxin n=1 Tax=Sphingomonas flavalba TaxID=2559804 RepID=UPI00144777D2|nr:type II toxin-antitoxin system prevent-host-death family antitoxin [Sphingomonas flavalba]
MMDPQRMTMATAAEVCRNFGLWQDRAMRGPVTVTNHGRPKTVLLSIDDFGRERPGGGDGRHMVPPVMLDQMAQGYVTLDEQLLVTGANRAAQQRLQRAEAELIGLRLADLYPELTAAVLTRLLKRVLQTGEPASVEAPSGRLAGESLRIDAFRHDGGVGYLTTRIDEDVAARALAADHDALVAAMAVHGEAGTARLTPRGTFAAVDDTLLAMLGFESIQIVHARLSDVVPVARRVAVNEAIERVLTGGDARVLDLELLGRGGEEHRMTIALAATRSGFTIDGMLLLATPVRH